MKLFFLLFLCCTDTDGDGVDLESPQGLGSNIPTIPEVNIHVLVGGVASSSSQRVDGPADIAKDKSEKPTQPVSIDLVNHFNLDDTNSFHDLNIQKAWMLLFLSHQGFSGIAIQIMHSLRTGSGTGNMPCFG